MTEKQQNDIILALTIRGCDIKGALPRFIDNRDFYCSMLAQIPNEENFSKLGVALDAEDVAAAFDAAHTLKGVIGNMGLTPMYEEVCYIVESLRNGRLDNMQEHYQALSRFKKELENLLESNS